MSEMDDLEFGSVIVGVIIGGFVGAIISTILRDRAWDRMNEAQQSRGDYWFDRYMDVQRELEEFGEEWRRQDRE